MISKSQDHVNHGFASEGFLVAFSLLDYQVQQFIETKTDLLTSDEKDLFMGSLTYSFLSNSLFFVDDFIDNDFQKQSI